MAPFNGCFRFIYTCSTGIKNAARGRQFYSKRFRYPRYIDERDVMITYRADLSHAFTALHMVADGIYRNEPIVTAYDVTTLTGRRLDDYKERIIICTEERILYVQNLIKLKIMIPLS